jgi:hypothetical protein
MTWPDFFLLQPQEPEADKCFGVLTFTVPAANTEAYEVIALFSSLYPPNQTPIILKHVIV